MAGIFLSYARENEATAGEMARVLEGAGHRVWWDQHIDSGAEFAAEIEAAIDAADIVLVVWSKQSVKSRWVRDEASIGGDSGKLVPISIDGTKPPMGFRQFHTPDLSGWQGSKRDKRIAELLRSIQSRGTDPERAFPDATTRAMRLPRFVPKGPLALGIVAALMLALFAGALWLFSGRDLHEPPSAPTFALLPLTQTGSEPAMQQLASQARDSLAHALTASGISVRLIDSVPQSGAAAGDFLISSELSSSGDKILATVRLEESAQRVTIFSRRFEADRKDAHELPDRIGAQIAGSLSWGGALMLLEQRRKTDPALIAEMLQQLDITVDPLQNYEKARRVSAKVPNWGFGQLSLAMSTGFALDQIPRDQRPAAVALARRASERARVLEPKFGDVYIPWCLLHSDARMAECEDELRRGQRVDAEAPFVDFFLSGVLRAVGRFEESSELAKLSHARDPYMPAKIFSLLETLETVGDSDEAADLYRQGVGWWPGLGMFWSRAQGFLVRGDFEGLLRFEQEAGKELPEGYLSSSTFVDALRSKSAVPIRQGCSDSDARQFDRVRCLLVFAKLGDLDAAFALAEQLYPERTAPSRADEERLWLSDPRPPPLEFITGPGAAPLRRDPRFVVLAARVGLLDYWRSGRPPDFCRVHREPICAQLLKRN